MYLISHSDKAENPEEAQRILFREMSYAGMKQQTVFYSNRKCNREELARTLYTICSGYPKVSLKISEDEFLRNFRVRRLDRLFQAAFD